MTYQLQVRKEAETDITEAYLYYESCRKNLGSDFILCLEESLSRISKNPNQYKTIHKQVRRALVQRFPFGIYYVVRGEVVSDIAVLPV